MSLNWDYSTVPHAFHIDADGDRALTGVAHTLIWMTIGVGLRGITEANAEEFAARLHILQRLDGPMMTGPDGPVAVTREDVLAHVGLVTNVADETRAKWITRVTKREFYQADQAKKARAKARV